MTIDLKAFPRQLRYWGLHCLLNALPSFIIASVALDYWTNPVALKAMGAAVLVFILLYSLLTSLKGPLAQSDHVVSRAIRAGAKFRMVISIASLPFVAIPGAAVCTPDFWCGFAAILILQQLMRLLGDPLGTTPLLDRTGTEATFKEVFATTIVEGMIISMILFTFSFFALLFIQRRERAKMYASASTSGYPSSN